MTIEDRLTRIEWGVAQIVRLLQPREEQPVQLQHRLSQEDARARAKRQAPDG